MANTLRHLAHRVGMETDFKDVVQEYRTLTLLNTLFNASIGRSFVPIVKTIFEFFVPVIIVMAIKLTHAGAPLVLVAGLLWLALVCALLVFMPIFPLAQTYELSRTFLNSLPDHPHGGICVAFKRSCRTLKNKVGSLYFVDRALILTLTKFQIDATIFLLINS